MRKSTIFITKELISDKMAGPAIRIIELAKSLSKDVDTAVATCAEHSTNFEKMKIFKFSETEPDLLIKMVSNFDSVILQGHIRQFSRILYKYKGAVVVDLYNPFQFESLEMFSDRPMGERQNIDLINYDELNTAAFVGDFYICASEKQRDMWIGYLSARGRINPLNYEKDCSGRELIDVVSFGIPDQTPQHRSKVLKGVVDGIGIHDRVILWGGGIWNWLDPFTPVRAIEEIIKKHPEVKLVFLGRRHPDVRIPTMRIADELEEYCRNRGLYNNNVFFNQWVNYKDRESYLLEADCGVSAHQDHIETAYSFRTRILDYIWAGIPVISTSGDSMQELIEKNGIGLCAAPGSVSNYADAIRKILLDEKFNAKCRKALISISKELIWDNTAKPLRDYCKNPVISPDRLKMLQQIENVKKQFFINISGNVKQNGNGFYFSFEKNDEVEANFDCITHFNNIGDLKKAEGNFAWCLIFDDEGKGGQEDVISESYSLLNTGGKAAIICNMTRGLRSYENMTNSEDGGKAIKSIGFKFISSFLWPSLFFEPYPADISKYSIIKLDFKGFRGPEMIPRILRTNDMKNEMKKFGKFKSALASIFFSNTRKRINRYLKDLNHNVHLQINDEINKLNVEQRSRIYSINRDFYRSLSNFVLFSSAILAEDRGIERGDNDFYLKHLENILGMFDIKLLRITLYEKG